MLAHHLGRQTISGVRSGSDSELNALVVVVVHNGNLYLHEQQIPTDPDGYRERYVYHPYDTSSYPVFPLRMT